MDETLEDRLAALERALTDGDHDLGALAADGEIATRVQTAESDIETLTERVAELEAATQALRGYVGNVRAVNEDVRERANVALETAERVEAESTESERTDTESAEPEPVVPRGEDDSPPMNRPSDDRSRENHGEEPTLELASDRRSQTAEAHNQSSDGRCPVCDGDTGRSGEERRRKRDSKSSRSDPAGPLQELTDGGQVQEGENPPERDTPGLLTRIRALL